MLRALLPFAVFEFEFIERVRAECDIICDCREMAKDSTCTECASSGGGIGIIVDHES